MSLKCLYSKSSKVNTAVLCEEQRLIFIIILLCFGIPLKLERMRTGAVKLQKENKSTKYKKTVKIVSHLMKLYMK